MDRRSLSRPRGSTMHPISRRCRGYSLIELLVVMVIITVLAFVAVMMIGDRRANAVRSVMDEIEGVLYNAQKASFASSRDIYVSTNGAWMDETLVMDARPLVVPDPLPVGWPSMAYLTPGNDANRVGAPSEVFRSHFLRDRDHQSAAVAVNGGVTAGWYAAALGSCAALETVSPVSGQPDFVAAIGNPIFNGGRQDVVISGLSKRFTTGFCVIVVGISQGVPVEDGSIGVLVVPRNSSIVYKYYKADKSHDWRLL